MPVNRHPYTYCIAVSLSRHDTRRAGGSFRHYSGYTRCCNFDLSVKIKHHYMSVSFAVHSKDQGLRICTCL